MADAAVSLGLDLTSFTRSLKEAQDSLGKGAARALAQAQAAAAEAAREQTRFAREQFRAQAEAERAAREAARETERIRREEVRETARVEREAAREAARLQAEAERAAKDAARDAATANNRLAALAAQRSEVDALTHAYEQQVAEIQRLAAVTGNAEQASQALAAATAKHQTALAAVKTREATAAAKQHTAAIAENTGETWKTQQAGMMFKKNIGDIAGQLFYGADALTVFSQQMPDLLQSIADAGGITNAAKSAFGGLAGAVTAAAPAIAAVSIAAAAVATAIVTVKNQTEAANPALYEMQRATDAAGAAFERARKMAIPFGEALRSVKASTEEQKDAYGVLIGTLSAVDVAEKKALQTAEEKNRAQLQSVGIQVQAAKARIAAIDAEVAAAGRSTVFTARTAELFREKAAVEQLLPQLNARNAAITAEYQEQRKTIAAAAEYQRELAASNEVLEEREKAAQAAAEAARRQADSERQVEERLKGITAALREQEAAAEAAFRWRMELQAAEVTAANLARAGVELQDLVATLEAAGAALEAEQALEFQRALAESYKVADQLRSVIEVDMESALKKAAEQAIKFTAALGGSELRQITNLLRNPGQAISSLGKGLAEAQSSAAESLAAAKKAYKETLGQGDVEATMEAKKALQAARKEMEAASPKGYIESLLEGGMQLANTLAESGPALIRQLVNQAPKMIHTLVRAAPDIITALVRNAPKLAIELATAFAIELPIAILANLPQIARALAVGIGDAFIQAGKNIKRVFVDIFREVASGGRRETRTFGDTPGPVRMNRATTARFSGGDYVVAARTREGLRAQAGGPDSAPARGAVVALDLRYGPMALGLAYAHADLNRRAGVGQDTTGRRSPWRR